jgi:hypothetical protein
MNSPEWMTLLIGCIVCLMVGGLQPIYAVLLAKIVYVSKFFYESFTRRYK